MEYKKVTITLPVKLHERYKKFVTANGFNMSGRMAILIEADLKSKLLIPENKSGKFLDYNNNK